MSTDAAVRTTQEGRRSQAERRLLLAAAELIGEVGPSRLTLAMIGERAGYSRGLATHHFGSKSALMQRLVDEVSEQFVTAIRERIASGSFADQLQALIDVYFDTLHDLQPLNRARLVLWSEAVATASADIRPGMIVADRRFLSDVADGVRRGVASGEVGADIDPEAFAVLVVSMLRGIALEALLHEHVDLTACQREVEILLRQRLPCQADAFLRAGEKP